MAILADGVDRLDDMARGIGDEIKQQDAYMLSFDLKTGCWIIWIRMSVMLRIV